MTRPNPYTQLTDRDSAMVQDALTRKCEICRAKPHEDCSNTMRTGYPLDRRLVHFYRTSDGK